ncbi:MAG: HAMP domain-containing protein [Polyangiaceae bacterium]
MRSFVVSLILIVGTFVAANQFLTERVDRETSLSVRTEMLIRAQLAARTAAMMNAPLTDLKTWNALAKDLAQAASGRVTIVRRDGAVIGDSEISESLLATVENHGDRPEIVAAFTLGTGASARTSKTLQVDELYVAIPFKQGNTVAGAMRIARPLSAVTSAVGRTRDLLIMAAALALLMSTIASVVTSSAVAGAISSLTKDVRRLVQSDFSERLNMKSTDEIGELGRAIDEFGARALAAVTQLRKELDAERTFLAPQQRR